MSSLTSFSLSFTAAHHSRATAFSRTCSFQSFSILSDLIVHVIEVWLVFSNDFVISLYKVFINCKLLLPSLIKLALLKFCFAELIPRLILVIE